MSHTCPASPSSSSSTLRRTASSAVKVGGSLGSVALAGRSIKQDGDGPCGYGWRPLDKVCQQSSSKKQGKATDLRQNHGNCRMRRQTSDQAD